MSRPSAERTSRSPAAEIAATWMRFWFTPADPRPLAIVRILAALLGLALLWSYAGDLLVWFGPRGMIPVEAAAASRPRFGVSLFDLTVTDWAVWGAFAATGAAFVLLLTGVATTVVAVLAAGLWASLMHRGPMLAGPADDCLAVLLWCLAIGGGKTAGPALRPRIAAGLMQLHASAIATAGLLSQLKGDAWWDGTAAWWLAARPDSRILDLTGAYAASEYLVNLVTHGITAFEAVFAAGLWFSATQRPLARAGLVAWPLIGILAGEPLWGCALAIFCVPLAVSDS